MRHTNEYIAGKMRLHYGLYDTASRRRSGLGLDWLYKSPPTADQNAKSFKHTTQFQINSYKVFSDTQYLEGIRINNGGSSEICPKKGRNLQVSLTIDFIMIKRK
jgi:hypothetical protein